LQTRKFGKRRACHFRSLWDQPQGRAQGKKDYQMKSKLGTLKEKACESNRSKGKGKKSLR